MSDYTIAEQIACIRREITMRKSVYPRWIETGKMTKLEAEREIALMQAVLETLRGLDKQEELPL